MKTCKICKVPKPLEEFHRKVKSTDGHESRCKACSVEVSRINYIKRHPRHPQHKNVAITTPIANNYKHGDPWFIFD